MATQHPTVDAGSTHVEGSGSTGSPVLPDVMSAVSPQVASEAPIHTGQMNAIDPQIMMHMLPLLTSEWKTTDNVGTILYSAPITPKFFTQWIRYLSKMYNVWAGSLQYQLILAATGFNGGKLMWVKLPPNYNPAKLSVFEAMSFDYVILDAKTMAEAEIIATDQRPVAYHYMEQDDSGDGSYSSETAKGGTIALYVLNPLIAASTGNASVTFTILGRPGRDFTFSQLTPIAKASNTAVLPDIDFHKDEEADFLDLIMTRITVSPLSESTQAVNQYLYNYLGKLTFKDKYKYTANDPNRMRVFTNQQTHSAGGKFYGLVYTDSFFNIVSGRALCWYLNTDDPARTPQSYGTLANLRDGTVMCWTPLLVTVGTTTAAPTTPTGVTLQNSDANTNIVEPGVAQKHKIEQSLGESIVYFNGSRAGNNGFGALQLRSIQRLLHIKAFKDVPKNHNPVYSLRSKANDRVIDFFRLNSEGYWSTSKRATAINYTPMTNFYLKFEFTIPEHSNLPSPPAESFTYALATQLEETMAFQKEVIKQERDRELERELRCVCVGPCVCLPHNFDCMCVDCTRDPEEAN